MAEVDTLLARLLNEPKTFTLGQAVRLLCYLEAKTPKDWDTFIRENTTIRPWLSLAFPSTELAEIEQQGDRPHYVFTTTSFGLYSTLGALPTLYTEELIEEARKDESVSRDFLDILNNHLAQLRYAANQHNRLEVRTVERKSHDAAKIQFCIMGMGATPLQEQSLPKIYLAEIFARRSRSAAQLERYLGYVLDRTDVRVEQCVERWTAIPNDQCCSLGRANASLGTDAMLGVCLRDSTGKFRIHLDSVAQEQMRFFLPGKPGHAALATHLRRFLDTPLDFELTLHPQQEPHKSSPLGLDSAIGFYIGRPRQYQPVRVFWKQAASV